MNSKWKTILCITLSSYSVVVCTSALYAADPVIHVQWDNGGTPEEVTDYIIKTTSPASAAFPDVELRTGHLDWRIWSTDADNTADGYVGDIGVISSPANGNFAVKLLDDSGGFGARDVKGITLVPTSTSYYGSLVGDPEGVSYSLIKGQLLDDLVVQADTNGNGGQVSLNIGDDVTANMTIHKVTRLDIAAELSGDITIDELAGAGTTVGVFSGTAEEPVLGSDCGRDIAVVSAAHVLGPRP